MVGAELFRMQRTIPQNRGPVRGRTRIGCIRHDASKLTLQTHRTSAPGVGVAVSTVE